MTEIAPQPRDNNRWLGSRSPSLPSTVVILMGCCCLLMGCDAGDSESGDSEPNSDTRQALESSAPSSQTAVAEIDDHPITQRDLEDRLDQLDTLYHHSQRPFDASMRAKKRKKVLQRLIDQHLLRTYVDSRDVDIDEDLIDRKLQQRIDRQFESSDAFHRYLDARNSTVSDFRRRIREEVALEAILAAEFDPEEIDDQTLREHYERIANRRPASARVQISTLFVDIPPEMTAPERDRLRTQLTDTIAEAHEASVLDDLHRHLHPDFDIHKDFPVSDPHWVQPHQLRARDAKALFAGDAPDSPFGRVLENDDEFHIYWVHERREPGVRKFDEIEELLRDRIYRKQLAEQRHQLIQQLRDDASISIHLDQY